MSLGWGGTIALRNPEGEGLHVPRIKRIYQRVTVQTWIFCRGWETREREDDLSGAQLTGFGTLARVRVRRTGTSLHGGPHWLLCWWDRLYCHSAVARDP